jgi:hypothetical protein
LLPSSLQPYYRRAIPVKALMRGFGLLLLGVMILGSSGCGTDNESDAAKLQNATGTPPPPAEGSAPTSTPKYSSMEDYAKNRTDPYKGTKFDPSKAKK